MGAVPYKRTKTIKVVKRIQQPSAATAITTQKDVKVFRGRKRLTKGQKTWKKFVRKVQKATDANDRSQFWMEANNAYATVTGSVGFDVQEVLPTTFAGDDYTLQLGVVGNIAHGPLLFVDNLRQQAPVITVAAGTTGVTNALADVKYKLLGACCTVSFLTKATATMFVDIYECIAAANITDTAFATARGAWATCLTSNTESDYLSVRTNLTNTFTGCTPYQAPGFGKYWKILKKTRIMCPVSSKTNYTYYTRPKFIVNAKHIGQYATKGLTKDLIIVANPTFHGDVVAATQFWLEWSKSYTIKMADLPGVQTQWAYAQTY